MWGGLRKEGYMAWFSKTKEDPPTEERSLLSIGDPATAIMLGYSDGVTPVVSEHTALTLSAVWRAVSLIAGTIGTLPLRTIEEKGGYKHRATSFLDRRKALNEFEWTELVLVYLLLHGNCYLQHIYDGAGRLVDLWPIHPLSVTVERDKFGKKVFTVNVDGQKVLFTEDTMTQIMGLSLDGLVGVSPICAARQSMGTALAGDKAASSMFSNGAMVSGMITPEEDLTEEDARAIQASVSTSVQSANKTGQFVVINRKLKVSPWTLSAEDAQFLESRAFQVEEVARWFGVPPHLLAQTEKQTSWGTGVSEQNRGLSIFTLQPWTKRIEAKLSALLPSGKEAEFDYSQLLQPSPEDEIRLLIEQVNAGLLTVNEARQIRNLPPLEDRKRTADLSPPVIDESKEEDSAETEPEVGE